MDNNAIKNELLLVLDKYCKKNKNLAENPGNIHGKRYKWEFDEIEIFDTPKKPPPTIGKYRNIGYGAMYYNHE